MTTVRKALVFAAFVLPVFLARPALAATYVSGDITSNTEWTTANSPYIVNCGVGVKSAATLTVDAGVVVKFNAFNCAITVYSGSQLIAQGTSTSPITFTSIKDDTAGGDTNGDGSGTSPHAGDWYNVSILSGATATLDYVVMAYGGWGSSNHGYGALFVSGGTATVDHSRFTSNQCSGIYLSSNGTVHVSHTEVNGNGNGISASNAYLDLKLNSNVHDNSDTGVWINESAYSGTASSVQNCDVKNNGNYGVYLLVYPTNPLPSGNNNNIYDNAGGSTSDQRQLYSYYALPSADWEYNYFGSVNRFLRSFASGFHLSWSSIADECSLPPKGPTSYVIHQQSDNTCAITRMRYCAIDPDTIDSSNWQSSYIDNSGL